MTRTRAHQTFTTMRAISSNIIVSILKQLCNSSPYDLLPHGTAVVKEQGGFLRGGEDKAASPVRNSPACSYVLATYSPIRSVVVVNRSWLLLGKPLSYTASSSPSTERLNCDCGVWLFLRPP